MSNVSLCNVGLLTQSYGKKYDPQKTTRTTLHYRSAVPKFGFTV